VPPPSRAPKFKDQPWRVELRKALRLVRQSQWKRARRHAKLAAQSGRLRADVLLFAIELQLDGIERLKDLVPELRERHPDSLFVTLLAARVYTFRTDREAMLALIAAQLPKFRDNVLVLSLFAEYLCTIDDGAAGLKMLSLARSAAKDPRELNELIVLEGTQLVNLQRIEDARELFAIADLSAVSISSQCMAAASIARILALDGEDEAALETLLPYVDLPSPQQADMRVEAAMQYGLVHGFDRVSERFDLAGIDGDHLGDSINKALLFFRAGDLRRGWKHYLYRLESVFFNSPLRYFNAPMWAGQRLAGKKILVWSEQGVGDLVMFASMIEDLRAAGASVVLEVPTKLVELFAQSFRSALVRVSGPADVRNHPAYADLDFHVPIGSLGLYFRTELSSFPLRRRWLSSDVNVVERLRREGSGLPRVGFAWSSGKRNTVRDQSYLALEDLLEWIEDPSIEPVCLNYRVNDDDRALIASRPGLSRFMNLEIDQWNDLYGTAALVDSCDVVVGAATSNTAIAGGLNKPLVLFLFNPARAAFAFATGTYPFYNWTPLVALKNRESAEVVADLRSRTEKLLSELVDPTTGEGSDD
jgi:hypothetical protein